MDFLPELNFFAKVKQKSSYVQLKRKDINDLQAELVRLLKEITWTAGKSMLLHLMVYSNLAKAVFWERLC